MKEIRGAAAVRYAREAGIRFDIDEGFLIEAEAALGGHRTSMVDIDRLIEERTGFPFDPAEIVPSKETFDFLVNRYGDGWIYVAVEGRDPGAEERAALRMFRRLLGEREPVAACDVKELLGRYGRRARLGDTGFPRQADLNLLFHAALRLSGRGELESVEEGEPMAEGQKISYGRRRFNIPADLEVSLAGVLCESCLRERTASTLRLHRECAHRLRKVLAGGADGSKARSR